LGAGPLGKAYYQCSLDLLQNSKKIKLNQYQKIGIEYCFDHSKIVHHIINKYSASNIENKYDTKPIIECFIEPKFCNEAEKELINLTQGNLKFLKFECFIFLPKTNKIH
jgi:putative IMPACT (imprinted ancient) family translation regulator